MNEQPENPHKWLLNELSRYLDGEALDQIQSDYEIVKRRYDLASKIRQAKQELAQFRQNQAMHVAGSTRYQAYTIKIDRRMERIKKLEQEISDL